MSLKIEEHRCCDICYPVSTQISDYVKQNKLGLCFESEIGQEWMQLASIEVGDGSKEKMIESKGQGNKKIRLS